MKTRKDSGRLVAQIRKIIGKSQSQFAALVGVSKHTIISVENGRNELSKNLTRRIYIATGAQILDGKFRLQPTFNVPVADPTGKITPEISKFLDDLRDRTHQKQDQYTRQDFEKWRTLFFPSNDDAAQKSFDQIKPWVEFIFKAAAKPGAAGNRDRLPAVYQSLVEWLNETREAFKLENEIESILEDQTRTIGRTATAVSTLLENPDRCKEELAKHGIDFNKIKKELKNNKSDGWLFINDEFRDTWSPGQRPFMVECKSRKLIPKAKYWIETIKRDPTILRQALETLKSNPRSVEAMELLNAPFYQVQKIVEHVESDYPSNTKTN